MNELPFISCLCCTYGRSKNVQESLACYLAQKYEGKSQLLILNTFPQQTLIPGEFQVDEKQTVKIVNLNFRPKTLGEARSFAVGHADGSVIATWDDDDYYLPWHLRTIGEAFAETGADWVRLIPTFYAEGFKIKSTFDTWANAVAYTRKAFHKADRYNPGLSVGEDRDFIGRLSEKCKGATIQLEPHEIGAIYNFGNGVYHLSGLGDDIPNRTPAYERSRLDLEGRIIRGQEPVGEVRLVPNLSHDPETMALDFLGAQARKKNSVAIVELGRYGDIINILPICKHIAENYGRPHLVVSKDFADILDGVSYVEPCVLDVRNNNINAGIAHARNHFQHVIQAQIWGDNYNQERLTEHFNKESWRMAGFLDRFDDRTWLPHFDLRNLEREAAAVRKVFTTSKPKILTNLTRGTSSPFPEGPEVLSLIRSEFGNQFEIVDVGEIRLERIYDLIGIIERCSLVVSIDTSLLHLVAATGCQVVALVRDESWTASECRGNCELKIPYYRAAERPEIVLTSIKGALTFPRREVNLTRLREPPKRRIIHVVERHKETGERENARKAFAQESWNVLYADGVLPKHYSDYKRTAMDIGDTRALPYLKDALELGMSIASDDDIILWTNDDNWLHPQLPDMVRYHCSIWGVVSAQRCEFEKGPIPSGNHPPEFYARNSSLHMGRDLFAFTKRWLVSKWNEIPDVILAAPDFDLLLAAMIRFQFGIVSTRQNFEYTFFPAEMQRGYVCHEYHAPRWKEPRGVNLFPSNKHNRKLFSDWASVHMPSLKFTPEGTV